jgi:hypothetical protein
MLRAFLSVGIVWLILATTALNVVSAFLPDDSFPARSHHTISVPAQLVSAGSPLGEVASVVAEGRNLWEIQQRSKQVLALVHSYNFAYSASQKDHRLRAVLVFVASPVRFFFPRKLSPPAAPDEPFLT